MLSGKGKKHTVNNSDVFYSVIENHYFKENKDYYCLSIYTKNPRYDPNYKCEICAEKIDEYIESIKAESISDNPQEYIDYVNAYKENYYDNHLTSEEWWAFQNNVPIESPRPQYEKLLQEIEKQKNKKVKPIYKDWEIPELMFGWIAYIIFFIVAFIFKEWYVSMPLQIIVGWNFGLWRQKKVCGLK